MTFFSVELAITIFLGLTLMTSFIWLPTSSSYLIIGYDRGPIRGYKR